MGGDGPPRGGTRGGRDQFDWETVKSDKDREFYLGVSVKASVGRWQKNKDILWYTKGKGGPASAAEELAAVKEEEERLMQEALGLRPVTQRRGGTPLDAQEMKEHLKRGAGVDGTEGGWPEEEATRVNGLGYSKLGAEAAPAGAKAGEDFISGGAHPGLQPFAQAAAPPPQRSRRHDSSSSSSSDGGERRAERKKRKAERAERRAERRGDKAARREERHHRSHRRSRSRERR